MHRALTALPQFRPCLVPWLFEKLQGREDVAEVLDLLAHCVERFGASEKATSERHDAAAPVGPAAGSLNELVV